MKRVALLLAVIFLVPSVLWAEDVPSGGSRHVGGIVRWYGHTPVSPAFSKVPYKGVCGMKPYKWINFHLERIEEVVVWLEPYNGGEPRFTSTEKFDCEASTHKHKSNKYAETVMDSSGGASNELTVREEDCEFRPRTKIVQSGTTLDIVNRDRKDHWLVVKGECLAKKSDVEKYAESPAEFAFISPTVKKVPSDGRVSIHLPREDLVILQSAMHHWMIGWIVVTDFPYIARTNKRGEFDIYNIPPGTYEVHAWHPFLGEKVDVVTVPEDKDPAQVVLTYTAIKGPPYKYLEPNMPDQKREIRDSHIEEIDP